MENVGTCSVHFTVYDPLSDVEVRMPSRSLKVNLTNDLFKKLQGFELDFEIK